jgi:rRNA processing protein Gar1
MRISGGDVTFLHIAYVKSTKNVGKLTCVFGRFKNPFFLWLIQILKAVTMIMVTAIVFFCHLCATQLYLYTVAVINFNRPETGT